MTNFVKLVFEARYSPMQEVVCAKIHVLSFKGSIKDTQANHKAPNPRQQEEKGNSMRTIPIL